MTKPQTPEESFAAMRESHEREKAELQSQIEALTGQVSTLESDIESLYRPAMHRSLVKESGWSEDSPPFNGLLDDLATGRFQAPEEGSTVEALRVYAAERGYLPPNSLNGPTANESAALQAARRVSDLSAIATSDVPPDEDQASAEALAAGDVQTALSLQNRKLIRAMKDASR